MIRFRPASARRRRGAFLTETITALIIALVILTFLTISIGKLRRSQYLMAGRREAMRRLETSLLTLQNGQPADNEITFERLSAAAPPNQIWIRATLPPSTDFPAHSLVGLVPEKNAPANTPTPPATTPAGGANP